MPTKAKVIVFTTILFVVMSSVLPSVFAAADLKVYSGKYSSSQVTTSDPIAVKQVTSDNGYVSIFTSKKISVSSTNDGRKLAETYKYLVVEADVLADEDVYSIYLSKNGKGYVSAKLENGTDWTANKWNNFRFVCKYNAEEKTEGRAYYDIDAYVNGEYVNSSLSYFVDNGAGDMDIRLAFDCSESGASFYWGQIDVYATNDTPDTVIEKEYKETELYIIDGYDLYIKGSPITAGELCDEFDDFPQGIASCVMPYGKLAATDAANKDSIIVDGSSLVVVNSIEMKKYVYTIHTGWQYCFNDSTGEGFVNDISSAVVSSGVMGKDNEDVISYIDSGDNVSYTTADFKSLTDSKDYLYFITEVSFVPCDDLKSVGIWNNDFTYLRDGWIYDEWNTLRYVYDIQNAKINTYLNGKKINEASGSLTLDGADVSVFFEHSGKVYYDDISAYYCISEPAEPIADILECAQYSNMFYFTDSTTIADVINAGSNITVYNDRSFSQKLSDEDYLSSGNVAVVVSKDHVYRYYNIFNYEDLKTDYQSLGISFTYDSAIQKISFSGNLSSGKKKPVTFYAKSIYSDENPLYLNFMSGENGEVDYSIILSDKFANRRYEYVLSTDIISENGYLITVDKNVLDAFVSSKINVAKSSAEIKDYLINNKSEYALDDDNMDKDFEYISKLIFNLRSENLYNSNTFTNAYMIAEGLGYVKNAKITFNDFINLYSSYLNKDYSAIYNSLTNADKAAIQSIYSSGIIFENFEKCFNDSIFMSKYINASTQTDLKGIFISYIENIPDGDFENINNEYYEEKVFEKMFLERNTCFTPQNMLDSFNKNVDEILEEMDDDSKNSGGGGGGSGSSKRGGGSISLGVPQINNFVENPKAVFSDIGSHWAYTYINSLSAAGIISGYGDGTFRPDNSVTRAEFVKILMTALNIDLSGETTFEDVGKNHWCEKHISLAATFGFILGDGQKFYPDKQIIRQDAAVILSRVFDYIGITTVLGQYQKYEDDTQISDYAKEAVEILSAMNIIKGSNGNFIPFDNLTRAQTAAIFERSMKYLSQQKE